jgi:hypothetical protein
MRDRDINLIAVLFISGLLCILAILVAGVLTKAV